MAGRPHRSPPQARDRSGPPYPRTARVNAVLRNVLGAEIERLSDGDDRLSMLTITAVETEPDLRHARVLLSSLSPEGAEALEAHRVGLQAAIARGGRMKRTPTLEFRADPAVAAGERVDEALRRIERNGP